MTKINAQILLSSKNAITGDRVTTFLLPRFPRCLLAELNTHRVFSRNAESSRAIPISKRIEKIQADPYIPTFTSNQKGMVGVGFGQEDKDLHLAVRNWKNAMYSAIMRALEFQRLGVHKDMANRLLEPFTRVPVIVTATEWSNFFKLRTAPDCNPDFRETAIEIQELYKNSIPKILEIGEWHIPFGDRLPENTPIKTRLKVSAARCARISYSTHDGDIDIDKDVALCDRLVESGHLSPLEHSAKATYQDCANYKGFTSFRWHL